MKNIKAALLYNASHDRNASRFQIRNGRNRGFTTNVTAIRGHRYIPRKLLSRGRLPSATKCRLINEILSFSPSPTFRVKRLNNQGKRVAEEKFKFCYPLPWITFNLSKDADAPLRKISRASSRIDRRSHERISPRTSRFEAGK